MGGLKFEQWDQAEAAKEVPRRLKDALEHRRQFERGWSTNEQMLFGNGVATDDATVSYNSLAEVFGGEQDVGDSWISINYMFKYLRYIHSQMSANPPSVVPRPTSADYKDRRSAEVAEHLAIYGRRHYQLQDRVDLTSLQTLTYGSGFMKVYNDEHAGEVLEVDQTTRELVMTGDIKFQPLLIWDVAIDHCARHEDDIRYMFQRHVWAREEAEFRFPKHRDLLARYSEKRGNRFWDRDEGGNTPKDRIQVWEYIERALPWNGMAGRRVFLLDDGTLLSDLEANPYADAQIPINILTDVDVPGQVYGRTFLDYLVRLQDVLNRLDSTVLDNIQAHGVVRMVVYDAAETQDGLPANSTWQVANIKGTAAQKPDFINPPTLMPDIYRFRQQLIEGMEQLAGVNESMFGQVKREMSGFSMQTAINAGNMVRRRLFNKYTKFVEWVYKTYLRVAQLEWDDPRKILVTGQEGALAVAHYSSADITNGFDLDVEYGAAFSLDPSSRREEIMQVLPLLKEAGYSMRAILSMLKFNDVAGLFDMAEVSERRQLEIFDEMIAKFEEHGVLVYIAPEELEEHKNYLRAAYEFRQSMAFKCLGNPIKRLIDQHIREREQLAVKAASPAASAEGPAAAGAAPMLGLGALPAGADQGAAPTQPLADAGGAAAAI